jgi:hypothetical protein
MGSLAPAIPEGKILGDCRAGAGSGGMGDISARGEGGGGGGGVRAVPVSPQPLNPAKNAFPQKPRQARQIMDSSQPKVISCL